MNRRIFQAGLSALLGTGCILGCGMARNPYPEDPLLAARKPVAGKVSKAPPQLIAQLDPSPPGMSPIALAAAPPIPRSLTLAEEAPMPPADLASLPDNSVQAIPVSRSLDREIQAIPAVRRQVAGPYDHSLDYAWLRGVLDRRYRGFLYLRYSDAAAADPVGGKVRLEDDARLNELQDGDVILVQGELVPPPEHPLPGMWNQFPRYRIRAVQLVQRPGKG